jgi:pimeloyl-ACP methyl ester carboxylesterase
MAATWVDRNKLNNSLLVFIHGIFGDATNTWRGIPDLLQNDFASDPRICSYDSYLFEYQSKPFRQPALDPFILDQLDLFLKGLPPKYRTTVLIGHSQGGLLAKLYVLRELERGMGQSMTIDMVITLGTPHRGRWILNPVLWAQHLPMVGDYLPFWQLGQLASKSANIRKLKKNWTIANIATAPCNPKPNLRYVRSVAVSGAFDRLVTVRSAAGMPGVDIHRGVTQGHISMAKPKSRAALAVELLRQELSAHELPKEILDYLGTLAFDADKRSEFVRSHAGRVINIVKKAHPEFNAQEVESKAAVLLLDFIDDFRKRPLRKLNLENAIVDYCERQLA